MTGNELLQWPQERKLNVSLFMKKIEDEVMRYMTAALKDAHQKSGLSPQEFFDILCGNHMYNKKFNRFDKAPYITRHNKEEWSELMQDPYSYMDLQACTKYLFFGSVKEDGSGYPHGDDLYELLLMTESEKEKYKKLGGPLNRAIPIRNRYHHVTNKAYEDLTREQVEKDFTTLYDLTKILFDWSENLPVNRNLLPLRKFWEQYAAEYKRDYVQPMVNVYELAQEIYFTEGNPLSKEQQKTLKEVLQNYHCPTAEEWLVWGYSKQTLSKLIEQSRTNPSQLQQLVQQNQADSLKVFSDTAAAEKVLFRMRPLAAGKTLDQLKSQKSPIFELDAANAAALVNQFSVMVDDTFLKSPEGHQILRNSLIPELVRQKKKLLIDQAVVSALFRDYRASKAYTAEQLAEMDAEKRDELVKERQQRHSCKKAIELLRNAKEKYRCLQVNWSLDETADSQTNIVLAAKKGCGKQCEPYLIFTMDAELAKRLAQVPAQNAVAVKATMMKKLLFWSHTFANYQQMLNPDSAKKAPALESAAQAETVKKTEVPSVFRQPAVSTQKVSQQPLDAAERIRVNRAADLKGEWLILGKVLGSGGEGEIRELDSSGMFAAKIYYREKRSSERREKLEAMIQMDPQITELCWPTSLLYDENGQWIGYLMPRARGEELADRVFHSGKQMKRLAEMGWDRRSLVRICENIAAVFARMHSKNILMGDVNPRNIMVDRSCGVCMVDCDSYQIGEKYRCPVGTPLYTPPEVHKRMRNLAQKDYGYLRTEGNERYALALLLFEILMQGKAPYVTRNNEAQDLIEAIINGDFPYRMDGKFKGDDPNAEPAGNWSCIWNQTTHDIKEHFYNVFAEPQKPRPSAAEWQKIMAEYGRQIELGHSTNELVPRSYKIVNDESGKPPVTEICELCGQEFQLAAEVWEQKKKRGDHFYCMAHEKVCRIWAQTPHELECTKCHKPFMGNLLAWQQKDEEALYCPDCRQVHVTCSCCGQDVAINRDFYEQKLKNKPIYCSHCREEVEVPCKECGKPVVRRRYQIEQIQKKGMDLLCEECLPQVKCEECGKMFYQKKTTNEELKSKGRRILCKKCREAQWPRVMR